jgi:hypothetical protein
MELTMNCSGSCRDQGCLGVLREQQKEENVFTQGTWVSHWGGQGQQKDFLRIYVKKLIERYVHVRTTAFNLSRLIGQGS